MFRSTSEFDKQLDKATSHLLLEPDWQAIIQICDIICQGDCQPKYAIIAIKKRFYNQNPYVALYSLQVLESVVKNCGSPIHEEVASKGFMDELRELIHKTTNEQVRSKILELVQTWAFAFRSSPKYSIIPDTLNILKAEGYSFPALQESDAMFVADRAPNWSDGDNCHRCRVQFSVIVRKHHCRACGQVFCGKCTPRCCTLPKYGIEKDVRVCEDCFEKHNNDPRTSKDELECAGKPSEAKAADRTRTEEELKLQEEEELQLALALSRSEAEHKQKDSGKSPTNRSYTSPVKTSENISKVTASEIDDPELARYLNRSYWEQKQQEKVDLQRDKENHREVQREKEIDKISGGGGGVLYPSAPITSASPLSVNNTLKTTEYQNGEVDEVEEFSSSLSSQLDIFVNRMKSNSSRGRSIANDSSVQTLFINITTMHSRLIQYIQQQDNARVYYEGLQDKLTQARDARAALDALREEHNERIRREAEEAERQRQMQMALKLEIMRKKKQEYLQYQRQLAMQRMQEEEREMQMRMEQQKQMYIRGQMPMQMPNAMAMPGYPPQQLQQQQQQQQQQQLPYMAQPPSYGLEGHRMPYAMPPYQGTNGALQPGPGGPNMMLGPGGPGVPGMMPPGSGVVPPGGAPAVISGAYGSHSSYQYSALPPHSMYAHQQQQQPASAPTAGTHFNPPMMMANPAAQPQHHQPQHLPQQHHPAQPNEAVQLQQQQPAVAELISFD